MSFEYEDILYLPHHVSEKRARMSDIDRAAQFSPFAALTGFDAAVMETARLTCEKVELDEDARLELNEILKDLARKLDQSPRIAVTHFVPDERKMGGRYEVTEGSVQKINRQEGYLVLSGGDAVFFDDMISLRLIP